MLARAFLALFALAFALPDAAYARCATGPYWGAHGGWGWTNNKANEVNPPFYNGTPAWTYNGNGPHFGPLLGFNFSTTPFFMGVEADLSLANITGTAGDPGSPNLDTKATTRINGLATLRAKFGNCWSPNLVSYITGGLMLAHTKLSVVDNCIVFPCGPGLVNAVNTAWRVGPTVGAGVEWTPPSSPFSLRLEYLYFNLGSGTTTGVTNASTIQSWKIKTSGSLIRFAIVFP